MKKIKILFKFFDFRFSIRKPPGQKMYIIDLSIMACLIDGEKCVPDIKILDSTQFRQIVCDLDVTFNLKSKQIPVVLSH